MSTDTTFKPFQPMFEEGKPADPPAAGKPRPPKADKPKRERKPRLAKTAKRPRRPAKKSAIPPAPKHVRPTRPPQAGKRKPRKPRTPSVKAALRSANMQARRALKLDLLSAMEISALLKPNDAPIFASITDTLQSVNKATRTRILRAIGKVFG